MKLELINYAEINTASLCH